MNNLDYDCTQTGSLDESAIDKEETDLSNHYLYGSGDDKSDYSYPLVGADGCLYRGNVDSAWSLGCRGQCSDGEAHDEKLKELGKEFEDNPIPEDAYKFEKRAPVTKTDSDRQIAVGVAMVPNSVDSQGDFERPETIQQLSEGYMEGLANGTAGNKVMHAVEASDDTLTHVENRVLDEAETIGGDEYPAGTWVVGKRVKDDALWRLIENGTLSGFSIGGYVHDGVEHIGSAIPDDVAVPDEMREASEGVGFPIREITDASVEEISLVDTPAVPEAQIQTAKGEGLMKASDELTAGVAPATEYLVEERGHDQQAARELAIFLNQTGKSATASGDSATWLDKAKSFFTRRDTSSPDAHAMTKSDTDDETEKTGRVLSGENVNRAMALHDIAIDMLDGTDVRQNRLRFTDDVSTSFSLDEFESKAQSIDEPAESGSDADTTESMNEEQMDRLAELTAEKLSDADDEQTGEKANEEKNGADGDDETEKVDELTEAVEQLADQQEAILERIENAEGASQQKSDAEGDSSDDPLDKLAGGLA